MTKIAELAGYSIGTVYQYFPERNALLAELMARLADADAMAIAQLIPQFSSLPLADCVRQILALLVRTAADNRVLVGVVLREIQPSFSADELEDLLPGFATLLAAQLRLKRSEVRDCDLDLAATIVLQSTEAVIHQAVLENPERLDDPVFLDELVTLVLGYIAAPKSPQLSKRPNAADNSP